MAISEKGAIPLELVKSDNYRNRQKGGSFKNPITIFTLLNPLRQSLLQHTS
jgi:hypothetical protein